MKKNFSQSTQRHRGHGGKIFIFYLLLITCSLLLVCDNHWIIKMSDPLLETTEEDLIPITSVTINIGSPVNGGTPAVEADTEDTNYIISDIQWTPNHTKFLGGEIYTVLLILTADNGCTFTGLDNAVINGQNAVISDNTGSTVTLSVTFPATDPRIVTAIEIKTQPTKLTYTHGDSLDLTGLVITLAYDDTTTEDVAAADFFTKNITANPSDGVTLIHLVHDSQHVVISYGDLTLATNNLIVNPKVITFSIDPISDQTYTGEEITPAVTVKDGETVLTITTDYTVTYTNNTNVGTATVTVTGVGNYAVSGGSVSFVINAANFITAPVLTLTAERWSISYEWNASEPTADSYDVYYREGSGLNADEIKEGIKITGAISGETINGLIGGINYSVLVTANKTGYISVNSSVATVTVISPPAATPSTSASVAPVSNTGLYYVIKMNISLTSTTPNARIYYTLNGNTPTVSSAQYTQAISISETTTVKAIAVADGYVASGVMETVYNIVPQEHRFSAGKNHSLIIDKQGNLWAFGDNEYGKLGDGTDTDRNYPVQIQNGTKFIAVSAAIADDEYGRHSIAIDTNGKLWAWGNNAGGQVGDGTSGNNRYTPVGIRHDLTFTKVAAGAAHNLALDINGKLYAWGYNNYEQIGDDTSVNRNTPVAIRHDLTFIEITAGAWHSLAIDINGKLYAWGRNNYGQLGIGSKYNYPFPIRHDLTFTKVATGVWHSLAIDINGNLWAWGLNEYGQVGDGTRNNKFEPVNITAGTKFIAISSGAYHSLAVDEHGNMWAFGRNRYGQLGNGNTNDLITPTPITGSFIAVSGGGGGESYSIALGADGKFYSWGRNNYGQLGLGHTTDQHSPTFILE